MKKFLLAVAVLCMGTMAFAGPNAGGTLVVQDANLLMSGTDGSVSVCGQGTPLTLCAEADVEINGASAADPSVFKVYAAFLVGTSPRLMGLTWGLIYDANNIILPFYGKCGDFELNDDGWPAPGTGSSVTWNTVQTGYLTPVYWFAAYTYGAPGQLCTGPNPSQGGVFGDDTIPAILDPIAGYSCMGFDEPGVLHCPIQDVLAACCNPATGACTVTLEAACQPPLVWHPEWPDCQVAQCPQPPAYGACCDPATGGCTVTLQADCQPPLIWHGEWVDCTVAQCPQPVPADKATWGHIKANYR